MGNIFGKSTECKAPGPQVLEYEALASCHITNKFVLGRKLGQGKSGTIYLCTDKETGEAFACKSISKKKLMPADEKNVRREVAIMQHLPQHPNVVAFKGAYEDDNAVHLVMELCTGGELFNHIVAHKHFSEYKAARVIRTIVEVVQMCHENGVIHRDLKPENFLYSNESEDSPLKVIDFGLSVFFKPEEKFVESVGSPYYMAPEVLKGYYGPEVDIWSAGVILYIMLCGEPPFGVQRGDRWSPDKIVEDILEANPAFKINPWPRVSESAKSLVQHMLDPDSKTRYNAQQVLDDPWLQNKASLKITKSLPISIPKPNNEFLEKFGEL